MDILARLQELRQAGTPCALVTVTHTQGSIPRHAGAKMIITEEDTHDTVGGGKFEDLVIADARAAIAAVASGSADAAGTSKAAVSRTYPLHEHSADSFGAICGGEVTVFIEAFLPPAHLYLVGGGHCAQAVAALAGTLGFAVTVFDDRPAFRDAFAASVRFVEAPLDAQALPAAFRASDAVAVMSRNPQIDTEAVAAVVGRSDLRYLGMIGSRKKIKTVFAELASRGVAASELARIKAPIGLDIGADTPAEIAVAVMAEILQARRRPSAASDQCSAFGRE